MSQIRFSNRLSNTQSKESTSSSQPPVSSPGEGGGDGENEITETLTKSNRFIGKDKLVQQMDDQLKQFEEWHKNRDWLAFHHHHYDWWMFPIDEISSRGTTFQLPDDVLKDLRQDEIFIGKLRNGVRLMVASWGWDIDNSKYFDECDGKQKWSHWPVRLYKAGKCMWLFQQNDYYQSLKKLAEDIKNRQKEKLDYFSHTVNGKADVLIQWGKMERLKSP
ncbi:unnamed protein product [Adineta steineri]|uniref:Uncharacterized protein n=1 Tax=Adineta steineri TaxID=433720 RepID=A0A815FEN0_9BILA|nr:unnamed protein product [Adineta steineri]